MSDEEYEEVEVPQGRFVKWKQVGDKLNVAVVSYSDTGGQDFNGNDCPELVGEVVGMALSDPNGLELGALATVTAGQASLASKLRAAGPKPGNKVKMEVTGEYDSKSKPGTKGKDFGVWIARTAAVSAPKPAPVAPVAVGDIV